jgi:hypothetical protein
MLSRLSDNITTIAGHYKKSVLKNIELLLSAILLSRTVNFNKLKDGLPNGLNNFKKLGYYHE